MPVLSRLTDLLRLYRERGCLRYSESVTQLEHALQCASLAEEQSGSPSLIAAALLHDVGHFFARENNAPVHNDRHEKIGAKLLGRLFGPAVCEPVALHVDAKRYLCLREAGYWQGLSSASQQSLILQGGVFESEQGHDFEKAHYFQEAVALRRFDDTGKRENMTTRALDDYASLLRDLLEGDAAQ